MALVVETGSGSNPNANSYSDLAFIRAYNTTRGRLYDIGAVPDVTAEAQAILAMDYLESLNYQGFRTFGMEQPLSWPRDGVIIGSEVFPNDAIPTQLKNAQAELAWQVKSGIVLFPTQSGQVLKRRKIGPMEREWFPGTPGTPYMPSVDAWLAVLLETSGMSLRVERV